MESREALPVDRDLCFAETGPGTVDDCRPVGREAKVVDIIDAVRDRLASAAIRLGPPQLDGTLVSPSIDDPATVRRPARRDRVRNPDRKICLAARVEAAEQEVAAAVDDLDFSPRAQLDHKHRQAEAVGGRVAAAKLESRPPTVRRHCEQAAILLGGIDRSDVAQANKIQRDKGAHGLRYRDRWRHETGAIGRGPCYARHHERGSGCPHSESHHFFVTERLTKRPTGD
ncbi:hypothetical protein D9M73_106510 [compost metagenome]